jgi:hypothetical protein
MEVMMATVIDRDTLAVELRRIQGIVGHSPTMKDLSLFGRFSKYLYEQHFSSWIEALEFAGCSPVSKQVMNSRNYISRKEKVQLLIDELQRIYGIVKRPPTKYDLKRHSDYSKSTYERFFPDWKTALRRAGIPLCIEWSVDSISEYEGGWLAGFIAGEGSFQIRNIDKGARFSQTLTIRLRNDDQIAQEEIKRIWGLSNSIMRTSNPRCYDLAITDVETCYHKIVPTFDKFLLKAKKQRDFLIWKIFVNVTHEFIANNPHNSVVPVELHNLQKRLYFACKYIKEYQSDFDKIIQEYNLPINPTAHGVRQ